MGAGALNECLTCVQRNGNSANPIYDDLVGDCVSCYEYDSSTPIWDGNACVACASGTAFNGETGLCENAITCDSNNFCTLTKAINTCETGYIAIDTAEKLAKIGTDNNYPMSGRYCLINDISLSTHNTGNGWIIIGEAENVNAEDTSFSGIFDGNGKTISDLYISRVSAMPKAALFAKNIGEIRNLNLTSVKIDTTGTTASFSSLLAGIAVYNNGNITNCNVSGEFNAGGDTGGVTIGGIVAYSTGGTISYCSSNIITTIDTECAIKQGGIVANASGNLTIEKTFANVTFSDGDYVGGILGYSSSGNTIIIKDCYTTGSISDSNDVGGLVGYARENTLSIGNSYSTIASENNFRDGGIIGYVPSIDNITINDTYYNIEEASSYTCGVEKYCLENGYDVVADCPEVGYSEAELQVDKSTDNLYKNWDKNTWIFAQGQYPKLKGVGGQ